MPPLGAATSGLALPGNSFRLPDPKTITDYATAYFRICSQGRHALRSLLKRHATLHKFIIDLPKSFTACDLRQVVAPFKHCFRQEKKGAFRDRVHALLKHVGLDGFADHYPWQLSGGMLQRSNLCRALIHEPDLLLLDEPFGALDQFTREELWQIMQDLYLDRTPTVLLVTHDLREAGFLASRVCVMSARPGRVISDEPVNLPRPGDIATIYSPEFVEMT